MWYKTFTGQNFYKWMIIDIDKQSFDKSVVHLIDNTLKEKVNRKNSDDHKLPVQRNQKLPHSGQAIPENTRAQNY